MQANAGRNDSLLPGIGDPGLEQCAKVTIYMKDTLLCRNGRFGQESGVENHGGVGPGQLKLIRLNRR